MNILGALFIDLDRWEESKECFINVISYESLGYANKQVDAQLNLAILQAKLEEWELAKDALDKAVNICQNNNIDIYRNCKVKMVYGDIHRSLGQYNKSLQFFDEVITLSKKRELIHIQYYALLQSLDCLDHLGYEKEFNKRNKEVYLIQKQRHNQEGVESNEIPKFSHWNWR